MDISFVILTWNSQKDIEQCIASIHAYCRADQLTYKIFIVDNGSSSDMLDLLKEIEKQEEIECIYLDKNYGTTYPRNLALKKVESDYVCVLDSDTELKNGSLKQLISEFESRKDIGLIAPRLILENGDIQNSVKKLPTLMEKLLKLKKILRLGSYHQNDFYEDFPFEQIKEVDSAISACWFFPKSTLDKVGLLDENIFYAPEDVDFSLRVWKAGLKIIYYPYFEILHKTQQISHRSPFSKISISHFMGLLYFYRKHGYWFSRKKIYKKMGKNKLQMADKFLWLMLTAGIMLQVVSLFAGTYYVSNSGFDGNPGTQSLPWATLQYAANQVGAGDTVKVANGTYHGFSLTSAGKPGLPIVFIALGDDVRINGSAGRDNITIDHAHYALIDGFYITGALRAGIAVLGSPDNECLNVIIRNNRCVDNGKWGIFTGYAKNIIIENNETAGSGIEHGIYVSNSSDYPVILNNIAHHNSGSGIQINADPALPGDGIISFAVVENNICYENGTRGGAALNFASIRNCVIKNNLLYNNHAGGMAFWDDGYGQNMGCKDNKICNNTVVMPSDGRWALNMINNSTGNVILNNILLHRGSRGGLEIDASSMDGLISDFNIQTLISFSENWISLEQWQSLSGMDQHSFSALETTLFVGANNYHLKENAPALDKGTNLPYVLSDMDGDARPSGAATDIGADELIIATLHLHGFEKKMRRLPSTDIYPHSSNRVTESYQHNPTAVNPKIYGQHRRTIASLQKETGRRGLHGILINDTLGLLASISAACSMNRAK